MAQGAPKFKKGSLSRSTPRAPSTLKPFPLSLYCASFRSGPSHQTQESKCRGSSKVTALPHCKDQQEGRGGVWGEGQERKYHPQKGTPAPLHLAKNLQNKKNTQDANPIYNDSLLIERSTSCRVNAASSSLPQYEMCAVMADKYWLISKGLRLISKSIRPIRLNAWSGPSLWSGLRGDMEDIGEMESAGEIAWSDREENP